jgi:hypothetical protein
VIAADHRSRPVRIGCVPDLPLQRLQSFLGALYLHAPGVGADVVRLRTAQQVRALRTGKLELGLLHDTGPQEAIATEAVYPGEQLGAFLPVGHWLAAHSTLTADDLRHEVLLVPPRESDPALAVRLTALLDGAGLAFRCVREATGADPRDVLFAVAEGRGVAIAPLSSARTTGEVGSIVSAHPIAPPLWMPETALAWRAEPPPSLARAELIQTARAAARGLRVSVDGQATGQPTGPTTGRSVF